MPLPLQITQILPQHMVVGVEAAEEHDAEPVDKHRGDAADRGQGEASCAWKEKPKMAKLMLRKNVATVQRVFPCSCSIAQTRR